MVREPKVLTAVEVSLVAGIGSSRLAGLLQHMVGSVGAMLHAEEHIVGNELAFFVALAVDMRFFHAADDKQVIAGLLNIVHPANFPCVRELGHRDG